MSEPSSSTGAGTAAAATALKIPEETRARFPQLIPMIVASPSMNDEERQYWIDVLPIMTEGQIDNLKDILGTEKKQIDAANKTYSAGVDTAMQTAKKAFDEQAYVAKKQARLQAENSEETKEKQEETDLLKALNEI